MTATRPKRILAVSSGGGHWTQLLIIMQAYRDHELVFATTVKGLVSDVAPLPGHIVPDFNLSNMKQAVPCVFKMLRIFREVQPDIIVSTGAAPGLLAVVIGALLRRHTVWVDSFTNTEKLSLSGRLAGPFVSKWFTQWPHLARPNGPIYKGSIL